METGLAVLGGLIAGGLGGMTLSLLAWMESGEPFNPRKNISTIMTATITGLLTTIAIVQTSIFTDPNTPDWQQFIAFLTIFGAAAGFGSMTKKAVSAAQDGTSTPKSTP